MRKRLYDMLISDYILHLVIGEDIPDVRKKGVYRILNGQSIKIIDIEPLCQITEKK